MVPEASAAVDLERLLVAMRPRLHRYCARMVGSVIDGEDVLQDVLIKAVEALAAAGAIGNPEGWLFRIAHNTALDFLRRRNRQEALRSEEEVDMIADQFDAVASRQIAAASLRTFMRLPVRAALQRDPDGRARLLACRRSAKSWIAACPRPRRHCIAAARSCGKSPTSRKTRRSRKLSDADRDRLGAYVAHFNARDFDAIRAMIADDVRLDLVSRTRMNGKAEVSRYFGNYSKVSDWHLVPGMVEGHPAILVFDPERAGCRRRNISCCWAGRRDKVATIRDFRYAPYIIDGAEYLI